MAIPSSYARDPERGQGIPEGNPLSGSAPAVSGPFSSGSSPTEVYILSREYFPENMPTSSRESGLSEIVGFILILAAIVMAVTLYATFGIPAQGREGEIAHMNEVKDRFVEFKVNVDS